MPNQSIYWPKDAHAGYYDKALQKHFHSKSEKREYMNSKGISEEGSMESNSHRDRRLADEINYHREKQGLKPKTIAELKGER